jgi:hypothetical protein
MTGSKQAPVLIATALLLGCSVGGPDPVRDALQSGAPHFVTRIENPSRSYVETEVTTLAGPIEMDGRWAKRFDGLLIDLVDQAGEEAYACVPNPGVKVTISGVDHIVRFLLCFECRVIVILDDNGTKIKDISFEGRHGAMGELVMEAFPEDQKLADIIIRKVPTN